MEDQENNATTSPPAVAVPENQSPGLEHHTVTSIGYDGGDFLPNIPQKQERLCDPFLEKFAGMMNHRNISSVLEEQKHMLTSLEVANEKLGSLNNISEGNYFKMSIELRQSTRTLVSMKRELDSVFRRIRSLKMQVATQYPEAYSQAESQRRLSNIDDEDG